jgi:hypothetical protein
MIRFTGGLAIGLIIGTGIALTDSKKRNKMMRDSKRILRKAGHFFEDMR